MKVLIVEDNKELASGISDYLNGEKYICELAYDFESAVEKLGMFSYDCILLDIMLPDGNGLELLKIIRRENITSGVLIISAKDALDDKVNGLEGGADDYVTKPFSLSVLLSKINAAKRHIENMDNNKSNSIFDPVKQTATIHGREINLTRNELRLLKAFIQNPGQILTKEQLLQILWDIDGEFVDENTLAVNIRRLREKIEEDPSNPAMVENIRGVGYRLTDVQQ